MNWYLRHIYASRKLPTISYRDLAKFLKSLGFEHVSMHGDHQKWIHNQSGQMVTVLDPSAWGSNSKNIVEYILKNMGISPLQFSKLWRDKKFRKDPLQHINPAQYQPGSEVQDLIINQENKKQNQENLQYGPDDPNYWRNFQNKK